MAFIAAEPRLVVGAAIDEMRREQREEPIVAAAVERGERNPLQHDIARRIGKHRLFDAIAAVGGDVGERESRYAVINRPNRAARMTLFFREIIAAIGDDEAEIAGAGIIDAWVINLVQDAVAERVPDAAFQLESRSDGALGARGPARRNTGPAGRLAAH